MSEHDDVVIEPDDESLEGEGSSASKLTEKLKKLREELVKANLEKQEYLDGWQRAKADYVNVRKRAEEDRQTLVRSAAAGIVKALLPALDSFDHALEAKEASSAWADGIKNTHAQLMKALEAEGLRSFDPTGETFDPNWHEPVETLAVDTEEEENKVIKTHQRGYSLNGMIIRPARVAVGRLRSDESNS